MDYEKKIDIPFGAHDSELKGWEYTIPEGFTAEIKDGKVIVREKESEDERIRKYLIEELKAAKSVGELKFTIPQPTREKCIAYLERQKEEEGYEAIPVESTLEYKLGFKAGKESEKQKESTWAEDDENDLQQCIKIVVGWEKDYDIVHSPYSNFLKSLPERFNLQPKQECGEKGMKGPQEIDDWRGDEGVCKKQKEPVRKFTVQELLDEYDKGYEHGKLEGCTAGYNRAMKELKQKEQKPVDFPTTDEEVNEFLETHPKIEVPEKYKTPDFVFSKQEYESHPIISKDTTSVRPAEWSDTNELVFQDICKHLKEEGYGGWVVLLNALRNGEFQPKQEWSEEDEDKLEQCIRIVSGWEGDYDIVKSPYSNFLKSLRPSWKPSDEQMQCLLAVITNQYNAGAESCHLTLGSLYNDLKKLI